ncbi:helix-turn-helix domain-containing protein [Flavobacterium sp. 245]|uniref:helix-turn-helix domain-containing protein n=1 Tax=Flavobacterium sp. 245 TaxID=2512115 RepID=UPI00105EDB22|nr:helix-turn-helix domain-containing protein [Flavobacterium sp. 245]TDO94933.1 AraC-like DNA-binding protein [Flavobacterium sp. 245]
MDNSIQIFSTYQYKEQFLPQVNSIALHNKSQLQLYRIENYLKEIVIPVPPYRTSFNFMLFVTEGYIKQQVETENYLIGAGQILNIKQGSITRTHELSENIKGFYLIYENDVINSISLSRQDIIFLTSDPVIKIHEKIYDSMVKIFELLETELNSECIQEDICSTFFRAIMLKIIKQATHKPLLMGRELDITYKFREKLQQEHKLHKNVFFYAQELNISETYLNKCIKKATGKPPKQWINEICVQHSQVLLRDLGREIADVAYELNFHSLSHFSRVFKKVTNQSPSAFRLQVLNK